MEDSDTERRIREVEFIWKYDEEYSTMHLYYGGRRIAYISCRQPYCDRGRYLVTVEDNGFGLNLDWADGRDLMFYMDLESAMWETVTWLSWRIHRRTVPPQLPGACVDMHQWAADNMPSRVMLVTDLEHRSTWAPSDEVAGFVSKWWPEAFSDDAPTS